MKPRFNIVKNVTPASLQCPPFSYCPQLFATGTGDYLVIGTLVNQDDAPPEVRARIGKGEVVIRVPKALLDEPRTE